MLCKLGRTYIISIVSPCKRYLGRRVAAPCLLAVCPIKEGYIKPLDSCLHRWQNASVMRATWLGATTASEYQAMLAVCLTTPALPKYDKPVAAVASCSAVNVASLP